MEGLAEACKSAVKIMELETITETAIEANVKQAVPFFMVANMEASIRYYVDGLGFRMKHQWIDEGKLRWCWLQIGGAALMLQEYRKDRLPAVKVGEGVSVCFQCVDALAIYREITSRGIQAKRPFVGNSMWVTSMSDPDGYKIDFDSPTDVAEETEYSEQEHSGSR
jgi:lactoylglutathione lyase